MMQYAGLSIILFAIGIFGVLARRNLIIILMSLELMLNAVNLALATFARFHANLEGHVFLIMVMAIAAVEVGVGLAIVILLFRNKGTIDSADFKIMKF